MSLSEKSQYDFPNGWVQTKLSHLAMINPKPEKNSIDPKLEVSFVPMRCVEALSGRINLSNTRKFEDVRKGYTYFQNHDIIFAKITPCMENGKIAILDGLKNGIGYGSTEFHVIRLTDPKMSKKFYFYYFIQTDFRKKAKSKMKGTAGQLRVPTNVLSQELVPIPPLNEQKRIVSKIESIFAQIDACKERLERLASQIGSASGSLAQLKSSVLKQAFEGQLTSNWRKTRSNLKIKNNFIKEFLSKFGQEETGVYEKGVLYKGTLPKLSDDWYWVRLASISTVGQGGTPSTTNTTFWNGTIPWLRSGEIKNNFITNAKTLITKQGLSCSSTTLCPEGSVLLAMTGQGLTRGRCAILKLDACANQSVAHIIPNSKHLYNKFLFYYLQYQYWRMRSISKGSNQAGLNVNMIKQFEIPFTMILEQHDVVRRIESIFANIDTRDFYCFILLENLFTNIGYFMILYHYVLCRNNRSDCKINYCLFEFCKALIYSRRQIHPI